MSESYLPSMRVDGQVAVVTGAGRGIGFGCARALGEAGAEVIAVARTRSDLDEVVAQIIAAGGKARAVECDVTDTAAMRATFAEIGHIDILINNAGMGVAGALGDYQDDDVRTMIDLNCTSAVFVAQAAARQMVEQGSGVIVNLSSTFGINGRPNHSVYSATKHFIEGFTKSTAIDTPMTHARLHDPQIGPDLLARIPMGRFGEVEDCAAAVVFLASPAAALITGTTIMVDGGWTAQ